MEGSLDSEKLRELEARLDMACARGAAQHERTKRRLSLIKETVLRDAEECPEVEECPEPPANGNGNGSVRPTVFIDPKKLEESSKTWNMRRMRDDMESEREKDEDDTKNVKKPALRQ